MSIIAGCVNYPREALKEQETFSRYCQLTRWTRAGAYWLFTCRVQLTRMKGETGERWRRLCEQAAEHLRKVHAAQQGLKTRFGLKGLERGRNFQINHVWIMFLVGLLQRGERTFPVT